MGFKSWSQYRILWERVVIFVEFVYPQRLAFISGLTLELNIEQSEYIAAMSPDAGVKIVIHERGTYPVPEDAGLSLPPGYKTSIGIDKVSYRHVMEPMYSWTATKFNVFILL